MTTAPTGGGIWIWILMLIVALFPASCGLRIPIEGFNASGSATTQAEEEVTMTNTANADVEFVEATRTGENTWRFNVTVRHPDTGWEDYADGWDVVLPDGEVILPNPDDPFTRLLLHPHVNEQPFTRSQSGIVIPQDVTTVTVRAHDIVDGFGGQTVTVDLTTDSGENYTVNR